MFSRSIQSKFIFRAKQSFPRIVPVRIEGPLLEMWFI